MFLKKYLFFATLAIPVLGFADVKPKMDQMLGYIFELKPFIVSQSEYTAPENAAQISQTLKNMIVLSEEIKHEEKIKSTASQVPAMSLNEQLKEAEVVFRTGNKSYSLWLLRSNLSNCVACHTQLPAKSTTFGNHMKKSYTVSDFQEAEFLYIIRNFDKSLDLYNRVIAGYPKNKISAANVDVAISRKIFYFTRVKRDLPGLNVSLTRDLKNKKLLKPTAESIKAYAQAAKDLAKEDFPTLSSDKAVQEYAEKTLKNELAGSLNYEDSLRNLRNLRLSGYLYEYMDKHSDTALRPNIYYWLSFCESRWEKGLQDSLPEAYLKKCILDFPKSKVAPLCYKEYNDLMTFGFTGSAGTNIPPEVEKELKIMRDLIGVK